MKKYAFFDVDQTIYNGYLTSSFTNFLGKNNLIDKSLYDRNMKLIGDYEDGLISYNDSVVKIISLQAEAVKGKYKKDIIKVTDLFLKENNNFFPFVNDLFKLLDDSGFKTYLVSAAASPLIEAVGRLLKTERHFSSELEMSNDIYTGKVLTYLNSKHKKDSLLNILSRGLNKKLTMAFGDSIGDIEMLSIVNHAFVINPHQKDMIDMAKSNKWTLVTPANIISHVKRVL